jgi:hypothetical protein
MASRGLEISPEMLAFAAGDDAPGIGRGSTVGAKAATSGGGNPGVRTEGIDARAAHAAAERKKLNVMLLSPELLAMAEETEPTPPQRLGIENPDEGAGDDPDDGTGQWGIGVVASARPMRRGPIAEFDNILAGVRRLHEEIRDREAQRGAKFNEVLRAIARG